MTRDDIMNRVADITKVNAWGDSFDHTDARYHINDVLNGLVKNDYDQLEVAAALALAVATIDAMNRYTADISSEIRDKLYDLRTVHVKVEAK